MFILFLLWFNMYRIMNKNTRHMRYLIRILHLFCSFLRNSPQRYLLGFYLRHIFSLVSSTCFTKCISVISVDWTEQCWLISTWNVFNYITMTFLFLHTIMTVLDVTKTCFILFCGNRSGSVTKEIYLSSCIRFWQVLHSGLPCLSS